MSNLCPMCGQPLKKQGRIRRAWSAYSGWRQTRISTFQNAAMTPWQPNTNAPSAGEPGRYLEAERRSPYRPQNAESDFVVPLLQALGTGAFVTVGAGWFAWRNAGFTWEWAVGLGLISAGGFWLATVLANRKLLWVVESVINSDLDNDGAVGQPEAPPRPIALEITQVSENNSFQRMFRFDLPSSVTEADFLNFARGVVNEGRGLAESGWIGAGKPFSRQSWAALMETLEKAGIVRFKDAGNRTAGRELTPAGGRALRMYLRTALTHSHSLNGGAESGYVFIEGAR